MVFRPLRAPSIATLLMLPILIGLGAWQVERLGWKQGLLAEIATHLAAPPVSVGQALALGSDAQYRKVVAEGRYDHARESYVFTTGEGGAPVYHVVTPFTLATGGVLMIDRGMVPKALLDPRTRAAGSVDGMRRIVGVWRSPDPPGAFTPDPDLAHRIWYARDVAAMARAVHVALIAPVIVEADGAPNPGGWPKGGQTVVDIPNNHLQYALTWFGLALVLIGVYLAYHWSLGRLGFRREPYP
jgi:surfeit locus 1 family protein